MIARSASDRENSRLIQPLLTLFCIEILVTSVSNTGNTVDSTPGCSISEPTLYRSQQRNCCTDTIWWTVKEWIIKSAS